jgi:MerR family transcriptional regulator, thiopeptide resistance regulator
VIPLLVYENIPAAHDFLVAAFGFESGGVERDDAGTAVHAEVRAGDQAIWLHQVASDLGMAPPDSGAVHGGIVVWVDDVDAHCAHARAAGADVRGDPADKPYGQREYEARDPEGHRWWFATPTRPA